MKKQYELYKLIIVQDHNLETATKELSGRARMLMCDGWQPQGGVAIATTVEAIVSYQLAQAMIK